MTTADLVVVTGNSHARVDSWGRPCAARAHVLLDLVASRLGGCVDGEVCDPRRLSDERWRCSRCRRWWSASHAGVRFAIAVCAAPVGVDIENSRHRPRALRAASSWCTFPLQSMAQWTQAEALWKAAGKGKRAPRAAEIPTPPFVLTGWQLSNDSQYWIYSRLDGDGPWSVAVERRSAERCGGRAPTLNVVSSSDLLETPSH